MSSSNSPKKAADVRIRVISVLNRWTEIIVEIVAISTICGQQGEDEIGVSHASGRLHDTPPHVWSIVPVGGPIERTYQQAANWPGAKNNIRVTVLVLQQRNVWSADQEADHVVRIHSDAGMLKSWTSSTGGST